MHTYVLHTHIKSGNNNEAEHANVIETLFIAKITHLLFVSHKIAHIS